MTGEERGARRPSVLFVGQGQSPTGFARVMESLLPRLERRARVHQLCTDRASVATRPWQVLGNPDEDDPQGRRALERSIDEVRPEIVVLLHEPWAISHYAEVLDRPQRPFRTVLWAAVDGPSVLTRASVPALPRLDAWVFFTAFGERTFLTLLRELEERPASAPRPLVRRIGLGVDGETFRPLDARNPLAGGARERARRQCFDGDAGDATFVVLNANRNQIFKRVDLTVDGFARFAADKPSGVRLCLHMATGEQRGGEPSLVDRLGVRDRLLLLQRSPRHPHLDDRRLNLLYNACDVGLNTSEGEGWGLIAFEHGATVAAQLVPAHSACGELWRDCGVLLRPVADDERELRLSSGKSVAPDTIAEALERLYQDRELLRERSLAAYDLARQERFSWKTIAEQWLGVFSELLEDRLPSSLVGSSLRPV